MIRQSPIPVFAAVAGLSVGAAAGGLAEALCPGCGGLVQPAASASGAVVGALAGGGAGIWAVRRRPRGRVLAAAILGLLFAGGAAASAATEVWRWTQPLHVDMVRCDAPRPGRKPVCESFRVLAPRGTVRVPVALATGLGVGVAGAAIAVSLQRRSDTRGTGSGS